MSGMSKRSRGKKSATVSTKGSKEQGDRVRTFLARLSAHDLKAIKVGIRRLHLPDLPTSSPPVIDTSFDDPTSLVVHRRGEGERPIFDREDIVVNVEEHLEERIVSTSPVRTESSRRARSDSRGERGRSRESYKHSYSRSPSIESSPKKLKTDLSKSENFRRRLDDAGYPRRKDSRRELSPEPSTSKRSKTPERRGRQYGDSPKRYERKRSRSISPKRPYDRSSAHTYSRFFPRGMMAPPVALPRGLFRPPTPNIEDVMKLLQEMRQERDSCLTPAIVHQVKHLVNELGKSVEACHELSQKIERLFRPPPYMVRPYLHTLHPGFRPRSQFRPARRQTPTTTTTTTTTPSENQTTVSTATSSSVVIEECEPEPEADNSVSTEH